MWIDEDPTDLGDTLGISLSEKLGDVLDACDRRDLCDGLGTSVPCAVGDALGFSVTEKLCDALGVCDLGDGLGASVPVMLATLSSLLF